MSIIDQKKEIFSEIASKKVLLEGFPELNFNPSFPSININSNSLNFLTDLLKSLTGLDSLKDIFIDIMGSKLPDIENEVKTNLKRELNSIISCKINPKIPDNILYNSDGINLAIGKIDFNDMFLTSPNSKSGKLLYRDIGSGLNSEDFDTFLYNTIQSDNEESWGSRTTSNDILTFKFNEVGDVNNSLNIRVSEHYSNGSKTLKDLNNDYVDSLNLFNSKELLNKLVDDNYGTISKATSKNKEQIINELKIDKIIDNIINQDDDVEIDNSFFEFDDDDLTNFNINATEKEIGIKVIDTTEKYPTDININKLLEVNEWIDDTDEVNLKNRMTDTINALSMDVLKNVPDVDKYSVKIDFIHNMTKKLINVISKVIISPKLITILAINHRVVHQEDFNGSIDFIKQNKYLMKSIFNNVRDIIINLLLSKVMKEIETLVINGIIKTNKEKIKNKSAVISGLVGLPYELIREINNIT
jgi:hypothetical protein